jgi:hypothetical protein
MLVSHGPLKDFPHGEEKGTMGLLIILVCRECILEDVLLMQNLAAMVTIEASAHYRSVHLISAQIDVKYREVKLVAHKTWRGTSVVS